MSDEPEDDAPTPFALAPSARPPTSEDIRVQVRVPPPSRSGESHSGEEVPPAMPLEAEAEVDALAHAATVAIPTPVEPAEPVPPAPFAESPPESTTTKPAPRRRMLLALVAGGGAIVLLGAFTAVLLGRRSDAPPAEPVASGAPSATPPASAEEPPAAHSSETSTSSAPAASATQAAASKTKPAPTPKPFDRSAAKAKLDALAPSLSVCKVPKGTSCQVKLTFAPTGHVTAAAPTGKCAGTAPGACVAARLKKVNVAPFSGKPTPFTFTAKSK